MSFETYEQFEKEYHDNIRKGLSLADTEAKQNSKLSKKAQKFLSCIPSRLNAYLEIACDLEDQYPEWALRADKTFGAKAV